MLGSDEDYKAMMESENSNQTFCVYVNDGKGVKVLDNDSGSDPDSPVGNNDLEAQMRKEQEEEELRKQEEIRVQAELEKRRIEEAERIKKDKEAIEAERKREQQRKRGQKRWARTKTNIGKSN